MSHPMLLFLQVPSLKTPSLPFPPKIFAVRLVLPAGGLLQTPKTLTYFAFFYVKYNVLMRLGDYDSAAVR